MAFADATGTRVALGVAAALLCAQAGSPQAEAPQEIRSAPCTRAPRIDGRLEPGEWDGAARHAFTMPMVRVGGQAEPREAELLVMNSVGNLYIAFRVPDAERQASLVPVKTDLVLLVFARGAAVAAGDDRKVLIPGAYADKHVVEPGKDADAAAAHGKGAMGYAAGQYTAEFGLPLSSGDGEDLAASPGEAVRFNLVYADGFAADLEGTEVGGLFTANADDASGWGNLVLAANVGQEAPAPEPEWLVRLFPHTGEPDECAHRLRRTEAVQLPVGEDVGGQVTCEFLHRTIEGKTVQAQARFFLPPELRHDPAARVPLMCNVGYELDAVGAAGLLAKGWAVSTPHAHPENPLGRGPNLDVALLHAARALPFVDDARVMIQGGSAGGYMALMVAAETFPLVCALPMVPPANWGYEAAYLLHNREVATAVPEGGDEPAMRVLTVVIPIADAGLQTMGPDTDADSWLMSSPISQLDSYTAPMQVVWSTGDILVPIDQVSQGLVRGLKAGAFPESFTTSVDALMHRPQTRATLLDLLPKEAYEVFVVPAPEGAPILEHEREPSGPPVPIDLPFSKDRIWSIVVIDEGPVEPDAGHFRYAITPVQEPFLQWAFDRGITADQLTVPKLARLMMRLKGEEYRPFRTQLEGATTPIDAVRLDFPEAERQDVLRQLLTFAEVPGGARRLAECYEKLPTELQTLGPSLGRTAEEVKAALRAAL